jgi:hypothetical protein
VRDASAASQLAWLSPPARLLQTSLTAATGASHCLTADYTPMLQAQLQRGAIHARIVGNTTHPWLECARGQDARLLQQAVALREGGLSLEDVKLAPDICRCCGSESFALAVDALRSTHTSHDPQCKLKAVLRGWNAVLGVLAICTDSISADDYLPAMAFVLTRAEMPQLASDVCCIVNFSHREDVEEMWVVHFVAAVCLMAELPLPGTAPAEADGLAGGAGGWEDISSAEGESVAAPAPSPAAEPHGRSVKSKAAARGGHPRAGQHGTPPRQQAGPPQMKEPPPPPLAAAVNSQTVLAGMGYSAADAALAARLFGSDHHTAVSFLSQLDDLCEMGFARDAACAALQTDSDPSRVIQLLLDGQAPAGAPGTEPPQPAAAEHGAPAPALGGQEQSAAALLPPALVPPPPPLPLSPTAPSRLACVAQCPSCKKELRIPESSLASADATAFQCPGCSTRFMVARKEAAAPPPPPEAGVEPPPKVPQAAGEPQYTAKCPRCDQHCRRASHLPE